MSKTAFYEIRFVIIDVIEYNSYMIILALTTSKKLKFTARVTNKTSETKLKFRI